MPDLEKVIKGLECHLGNDKNHYDCDNCQYGPMNNECDAKLVADALALLKALTAFKRYFDGLYWQGLEVANWHMNGATEPFDGFYDSAIEEYENAKRADTQRDYQAAVEMTEYLERYESTYNPEDGSM